MSVGGGCVGQGQERTLGASSWGADEQGLSQGTDQGWGWGVDRRGVVKWQGWILEGRGQERREYFFSELEPGEKESGLS